MRIVCLLEFLTSSKWSVAISKITHNLVNHIRYKTEYVLADDDKMSSIQWSFNEIGNRILLKLLSGRVYLCHIYVHAMHSEYFSDISKKNEQFSCDGY